jgi:hypothetical protein
LEFVLVDVDLTGTDAKQDTVVGFAALPLIDGRFRLDDLHYCRFPDPLSIAAGHKPPIDAEYRKILDLLTGRTVFTLNPRFVGHMLAQSAARLQWPAPPKNWRDLSAAARVIGNDQIVLTDSAYWQDKMKTGGRQEHDAVYDVFAMAQLLQALLAYAEAMGIDSMAALLRNQNAETWLRPY